MSDMRPARFASTGRSSEYKKPLIPHRFIPMYYRGRTCIKIAKKDFNHERDDIRERTNLVCFVCFVVYDGGQMKKIIIAVALILSAAPLRAQTAENVLVVVNEASPLSIDIGMYYAQKRGVPQSNLLRIKTTTEENISREDFERQIDSPIANW